MFVVQIIDMAFMVYMLMLFARILGSWIPEFQATTGFRFVSFYTDPYLNVFRQVIPPLGMIDISPIVAFFALKIIEDLCKGTAIWLMSLAGG